MRLTAAAALALALAACAPAAPERRVQPLDAPALGLAGPDTPAIADRWWSGLGDPQLDTLIDAALAGAPRLDAAEARIRQAAALLEAADAANGPDASFTGSGQVIRLSGRSTIPPPFAGSTRFLGELRGNLNWNLDLFGRQAAAIRNARDTLRAAELDREAARLSLTGAVVSAYAELARAERQGAIAARASGTRAESLRLTQVRIRSQLASELDARAAETLLAQARQAEARAAGARRLAIDALAQLTARSPEQMRLAPTRLPIDAALPLPTRLPGDLLARRPDIAAARARVDAAAEATEVARRAFYPQFNLLALAGLSGVGIGNVITDDAVTYGGGAGVSLPIFDNGRRRAELNRSAGALDLAAADYNEAVLGAVREAADNIARIDSLAAERQRASEVSRGFAETQRLNTIRVSSGLESRLGLTDTDIRRLEADQIEANLSIDALLARVRLVLALGGGFRPPPPLTASGPTTPPAPEPRP